MDKKILFKRIAATVSAVAVFALSFSMVLSESKNVVVKADEIEAVTSNSAPLSPLAGFTLSFDEPYTNSPEGFYFFNTFPLTLSYSTEGNNSELYTLGSSSQITSANFDGIFYYNDYYFPKDVSGGPFEWSLGCYWDYIGVTPVYLNCESQFIPLTSFDYLFGTDFYDDINGTDMFNRLPLQLNYKRNTNTDFILSSSRFLMRGYFKNIVDDDTSDEIIYFEFDGPCDTSVYNPWFNIRVPQACIQSLNTWFNDNSYNLIFGSSDINALYCLNLMVSFSVSFSNLDELRINRTQVGFYNYTMPSVDYVPFYSDLRNLSLAFVGSSTASYSAGFDDGYLAGYNAQFTPFSAIFNAVEDFLTFEILPDFSLGNVILLVFGLTFMFFLFKAFLGG